MNHLEAGIVKQADVTGEGMRDFCSSGNEETRHINHWLTDNCIGNYYTRGGLDDIQREMIAWRENKWSIASCRTARKKRASAYSA
jgi:4-carboxymuconolactone decarboxylase